MRVIQFTASLPRYALGLAAGKLWPEILWSGMSCTVAKDVPAKRLPGQKWVRIRTRYGGICGSDLSVVRLSAGPFYAPYVSAPFTFGHENVGFIQEVGSQVKDWQVGQRVVVEPLLWCGPRGFDDYCPYCIQGDVNRCERIAVGDIAPGIQVGSCRDTGGSWSASFIAHALQLYLIPDEINDENALMLEPLAIGIHAALRRFPERDERVLIMGAGTVGLTVLAALRGLGSQANIHIIARYPFQEAAARRLGASEVIRLSQQDSSVEHYANRTGSAIMKPGLSKTLTIAWRLKEYFLAGRLPKPPLEYRSLKGNFDLIYECVGTPAAVDEALKLTNQGGNVILVGEPGMARGVDWTAAWAKELDIFPAYLYSHNEIYKGQTRRTFDLGLELMARGVVDLSWLVTHKYPLDAYREALLAHTNRGRSQIIKGVFDFGASLD